jgi:dolichol-phosphate mannosyltransferase
MELSVVVPTFNEKDNVRLLVDKLSCVLQEVDWEVVFVDDDSPDGTADSVRTIANENRKVRVVQRIGRRGLSSACVEGMLSSSAPYLAVMDGDLQHDERILPEMLRLLKEQELDIVVGSRYVVGGGTGDWDGSRLRISRFATWLGKAIVPSDLTDPMSGFFMIKRKPFEQSVRNLSSIGFKILLDLFASAPAPLRFREVPYKFRSRLKGESKLDARVMWDFVMLLLDKLFGRWIPARFVSFVLVGASGVVVHMSVFGIFFHLFGRSFVQSQSAATIVAMIGNYALNNLLTYREQRIKGRAWFGGLASFALVCSVGAVANVGVANFMFQEKAGWALSALAGILVGAVWNYAVTGVVTWRNFQR